MFDDILLNTSNAKKLHDFAKQLPIIDFHNHLSISDIKTNKRFLNIYTLWVEPDPYKHRAMRMCGVPERYITGRASDQEKFVAWCQTIPKLIGNPLYFWSIMELNNILPLKEIPNGENAERIYSEYNKYLKNNIVTVNSLFELFRVEAVCPCASLTDDISAFENSKRISPSLRCDDAVMPTLSFINKLSKTTNIKIDTLESFKRAVSKRLEIFKNYGCVFSDHALDNGFKYFIDDGKNDARFKALLNNELDANEFYMLFSHILLYIAKEYSRLNFVMQLHIGAQRFTSTKLRNEVGPTGGFAGIGNSVDIVSLTSFLDELDSSEYGLPKTILFTLNPSDNAMLSTLSGSYRKDGVCGIITQGPAWWWCDHKKGIEDMLESTSAFSVLSNFVGMTTDSRSFLSFVRHDYFRRILCSWLANKIDSGEILCTQSQIENLIAKLSYKNAQELLFNMKL